MLSPSQGGRTALSKMRSSDLWRVTKVDTTNIMHDSIEHEWCPEYKSKDDSIYNSYTNISMIMMSGFRKGF